ncbi:MAG: NMD3-related protein [Candidatus Woesearchaeota archaeon]
MDTTRAERRKRLAVEPESCVRAIKAQRCALPHDYTLDTVMKHITSMLHFSYNHVVQDIVLRNEQEVWDALLAEQKQIPVQITITTLYEDAPFEEHIEFTLQVTYLKEPSINPQYFQAIIQLRYVPEHIHEEIVQLLATKKVIITKKVVQKHGVDYYVDNTHNARATIGMMKRKYGGEVVLSNRLHGVHKMTSKLLYRTTILYRFAS